MKSTPRRCVVDTNVPATANGMNEVASPECVAACARALAEIMGSGHVFVDDAGLIVAEYRQNLRQRGEPGPGDRFLRWLLTHEWAGKNVTRVALTPDDDDDHGFVELPRPPKGTRYDPSDKKFLAVAAAHAERPPVLQALDSKWWGWRDALAKAKIQVHFLCAHEIAKKHASKTKR